MKNLDHYVKQLQITPLVKPVVIFEIKTRMLQIVTDALTQFSYDPEGMKAFLLSENTKLEAEVLAYQKKLQDEPESV